MGSMPMIIARAVITRAASRCSRLQERSRALYLLLARRWRRVTNRILFAWRRILMIAPIKAGTLTWSDQESSTEFRTTRQEALVRMMNDQAGLKLTRP